MYRHGKIGNFVPRLIQYWRWCHGFNKKCRDNFLLIGKHGAGLIFNLGCQNIIPQYRLFRIWTKQINPNCRARNIFHNDFCLSVLLKIQRRLKMRFWIQFVLFVKNLRHVRKLPSGRVRKCKGINKMATKYSLTDV